MDATSVAVRNVRRINATGFELWSELHDAIALGEYRRPPNHRRAATGVFHTVYLTRRLDERASRLHVFGAALVGSDEVLLGERAVREDDVAHALVVMPRDAVAGVHGECMNLNCGW